MINSIPFPRQYLNQTYKTIRNAFENGENICIETGPLGDTNLSAIYTKLIQDVGRFAEHYASDMLYSIHYIDTLCNSIYPIEECIDEIYVFGIRKSGVDGNGFLMSRLTEGITPYNPYLKTEQVYRKVLAVRVLIRQVDGQPKVHCQLKNITSSLYKPAEEDLDSQMHLIELPKKENKIGTIQNNG